MKSKIISAAFLSFALVTGAFAGKPEPLTISREISVSASVSKIVVNDNVNVVLVQDNSRSFITVSGDEKAVQYIQTVIVNDQLRISAKRNLKGKNITVYVPVKNISTIELLNGSSVSGERVLKFLDLTVVVNDECRVALNTVGKMTIKSNDDLEFVYEKNEKYKVISAKT